MSKAYIYIFGLSREYAKEGIFSTIQSSLESILKSQESIKDKVGKPSTIVICLSYYRQLSVDSKMKKKIPVLLVLPDVPMARGNKAGINFIIFILSFVKNVCFSV